METFKKNKTPKKIQALIKLIDDPDENIYSEVKNQLLLLGPVALPYLEKILNDTMNSFVIQRVEEIIEDIRFNELANELINWKYRNQEDLLYAVYLINHFQYSEVTLEYLEKKLEQIKKDIWIEFAEDLTAPEEIEIINYILYTVYEFAPNIANYYSVQNNYLHYVLENKKGNSVSLGLLYLIIAQKLKLPIFAVNIPYYLILTYIDNSANLFDASSKSLQEVTLFYINPFSKGNLLQKSDIKEFLNQMNIEESEEYYIPCSNVDVIEKLLMSIANSYAQQGNYVMYNKYKNIAIRLKSE